MDPLVSPDVINAYITRSFANLRTAFYNFSLSLVYLSNESHALIY
nr:MAG TPA: hypothetical protein [Caudoviricetes sp.]